MAKDPAFLFYPGDYLRDTQCLSEPVQVAYDRIMCEHMRNICISKKQLKFFTKRLTEEQLEELMMVLTEVPGGFQIDWVAESVNKRKKYSESRRNNRKKKTDEHMLNTSETYDEHMENENENEIIDTDIIDPRFQKWFTEYGKEIGEHVCSKYWQKAMKPQEKEMCEKITPLYVDATPKLQYRMNPLKFLQGKYYMDKAIMKNFNEKNHDWIKQALGKL